MRYQSFLPISVMSLCIIVSGGCFSSHPKDINAFIKPHEVDVTSKDYILQPPDEIEIHCSKVPEIDLQLQRIRPDGKVAFEALGEFHAAGKTPRQLAELMREKVLTLYSLKGEYPIEVRIETYKSKYYYVVGQVYFPGPKTYTGRDTLLKALAEARLSNLAWEQHIQVVRPSSDPTVKPKIFEVDFDRMAAHGDISKNVLLQEGDIIFVPPTILAAAGLVLDEFISPVGRAFSSVSIVQPAP